MFNKTLLAIHVVCMVVGSLSLASSMVAQTSDGNSASSQVPRLIQFSNVATDEGGNPLSGVVSITFSLYNSQQDGEPLWMETQDEVQIDPTGHYSVRLGVTQANGLPAALFTADEAHWLGVRIAGRPEQARIVLLSVPYAVKAEDAATIGGLPPSAFVLAAPPTGSSVVGEAQSANVGSGLNPSGTAQGTMNFIPRWTDNRGHLGNSVLFQGGTASKPKIGIGTTDPATTLEVKGGSMIRGTLSLPGAIFAISNSVLQSLINDLASGGAIYLPCGSSFLGPMSFRAGIAIKSLCVGSYGTDPYIAQPYTTSFDYSSSLAIGPVSGLDIEGINFNFSGTGRLILTGIRQSVFDISVSCVTGSPCVQLTAKSGTANNAFNRFNLLNVITGGAIGVQFSAATGSVVTDNDFRFVGIDMTPVGGGQITEALGFTQNCDSNHIGSLHMFFTGVTAGNGLVFNDSSMPGRDTDADNEVIDLVDMTSGVSITGTAYTVNKSYGNKWVEGFGQTNFTTPIFADRTTNYIREFLEEGGIALGTTTLVGYPGSTMYTTHLPTGASGTLLQAANLLISEIAPTISSGFGSTASITTNNGTAAFTVNVGGGGTASSGVIGLPTATNGWNCWAVDLTNPTGGGGYNVKQTAGTASSAELTGYNTSGSVTAWTAGDILSVSCFAR
jgi:hypothetical protein